jgi:hypothetical protein
VKFKLKLKQVLTREADVVIEAPDEDIFTEFVQGLLKTPVDRAAISVHAPAWSDPTPMDSPGNGVMVRGWDNTDEDVPVNASVSDEGKLVSE